MGVRDIFGGIGRAASMFEEPVAVAASKDDSDGVKRRGTVSAVVVVGAGLSAGAGALVHPETADRFSVVVRRDVWRAAFSFPPRFGMRFTLAKFGEVTVKSVQESPFGWTCRCAKNMRATER